LQASLAGRAWGPPDRYAPRSHPFRAGKAARRPRRLGLSAHHRRGWQPGPHTRRRGCRLNPVRQQFAGHPGRRARRAGGSAHVWVIGL